MDAKGISNLALVDKGAFGGRSEEECLLKRDEYGSNMHSGYQNDPPPIGISNRDAPHKPAGKKETQNIQGEAAATALNALQLLFWPH